MPEDEAARIADIIIETVRGFGKGTSLAQVEHALDAAGIDYRGDYWAGHDEAVKLNIYEWLAISKPCSDAFGTLVANHVITVTPTTFMVYMVDGGRIFPDVKIAKQARKYRDPRWLPVTIAPGENFPAAVR